MSDKVDKFCEALRVNLTRVEDYISKVGENLKSASTTAEEESTVTTTTTTVPRTTTTTLPWAYFGNYEYDCRSNFNGYECSRSFSDIIYCSSIKENSNCSEYWYPDTLEKYDIYEYNFETIICEYSFSLDNISKCKRFSKYT